MKTMTYRHDVIPDTAHPLALELTSLRTSLNRFQHIAHKTSMQLQGKIMELTMSKETERRVSEENRVLREELEVLRAPIEILGEGSRLVNPGISATTSSTPSSVSALAELTLAHRRLSAKLDISESSHLTTSRALAEAQAEIEHLHRERDRKEELIEWWKVKLEEVQGKEREQRIKRRKIEEDLKVCEHALRQAKVEVEKPLPMMPKAESTSQVALADSRAWTLDGPITALPLSSTGSDLTLFNEGSASAGVDATTDDSIKAGANDTSEPSTPSQILSTRLGVQQLFQDFQSDLSASESRCAKFSIRIEELEATIDMIQTVAKSERDKRVDVEAEIQKMRADDQSAGLVVERYMAFTQKTSKQLHAHLQAQTTRLNQTISTLRYQLLTSQRSLGLEVNRTSQLRGAIDELAEGFERETFGRRREIGLRIKGVEREERRCDEARRWSERVRRERGKLNVVSPSGSTSGGNGKAGNGFNGTPSKSSFYLRSNSSSSSIASSSNGITGGNGSTYTSPEEQIIFLWDLLESGLRLYNKLDDPSELRKVLRSADHSDAAGAVDLDEVILPDSGTGRVILAEGMVGSLMDDLEAQTKRRLELEKRLVARLVVDGDSSATGEQGKPLSENAGLDAVVDQAGDPEVEEVIEEVTSEDIVQTEQVSIPEDMELPRSEMVSSHSYPGGSLSRPPEVDAVEETLPVVLAAASSAPDPRTEQLLVSLESISSNRYAGLQKALHDCAASVSNLRHQSSSDKQLDEDQEASLNMLLDGVHDVIEDVRVEVEIAITDDERIARGFQTLLSVTPTDAIIVKAQAFVEGDGAAGNKMQGLQRKLGDVENDLVQLKVAALTLQSGEGGGEDGEDSLSDDAFARLQLKTIKSPTRHAQLGSSKYMGIGANNGMQRGFFGSLGRTFSGTTPTAPLGRTSSIASLLPRAQSFGDSVSGTPEVESKAASTAASEDDVE